MKIDITHNDIRPELCQRCAACCRINLPVPKTDTMYRQFLRIVGYNVQPPPKLGEAHCCHKEHDIKIDMGYCKLLEMSEEGEAPFYRCKVYGTEKFPQLCGAYDCVSWAQRASTFSESNRVIKTAQKALNLLRKK